MITSSVPWQYHKDAIITESYNKPTNNCQGKFIPFPILRNMHARKK